jgi:alkylated DNA repair dioxygenase AlkB
MAVSEEPEGLVYRAELLSSDEEAELLARLSRLRFDPIVLRGQTARRTARHYGLDYDYGSRTPKAGEPIPDWLEQARRPAAALAGIAPEELIEALIHHYPAGATIGWHRDAPAFGIVVGISLAGASRLRFQRGQGGDRRTWELPLDPRSGYVLTGEARSDWQHSIPPAKTERYSITFRTLRGG